MYLSVTIRHTLISSLSKRKKIVLRSFRSLSLNEIWSNQNPTLTSLVPVGTSVPRPNIGDKGNNDTIKRQHDGASTTAN
jgi:hypothetical protein